MQDGEFDVFLNPASRGAVVNNGFVSHRTAFEYPLDLPSDAAIVSATLELSMIISEGTRSIQFHGYPGDGTQQLTDFSFNQLLATEVASANTNFVIDVKAFVEARRAAGSAFVGFNLREAPANTGNFLIMYVQETPTPVLRIEYLTRQ